jgi:hypothetical protein
MTFASPPRASRAWCAASCVVTILLEMPEAWNQISFDDHVHDANTKGRKSSTHLIMDAWIKGIRRLRVVHYNYIEPRFAAELAGSGPNHGYRHSYRYRILHPVPR